MQIEKKYLKEIYYIKHDMKIIYPDGENANLKAMLYNPRTTNIFLAGTIDNGNSKDWQSELINKLDDLEAECNIYINAYNPRRQNWVKNPSKELIEEQIKWEQEKLDESDLIIMVFSDNSQSPITLLELGLYAESGKLIVFCTNKFWRFDNVRLTCEKYLVPLVQSTKTIDIVNEIKNIYK